MNSLSTIATLFVLGIVAVVNVDGLPSPGDSSAIAIESELLQIDISLQCDRDEVFSVCNGIPGCQKTCANYRGPIACLRICYPGCVCKEGFVRNLQGGQCIPIDEC